MDSEFSEDAILGGSIIIKQNKSGFRISSDSIFLAASVPGKIDQYILDVGAGTGAISLVLAKRYSKSKIYAIENFPAHIELLSENILLNNLSHQITAIDSNISKLDSVLFDQKFDHIVTNPPFYQKNNSRLPANLGKRVALHEGDISMKSWINYCKNFLKVGGSFTLIIPYVRYDEVVEIFSSFFFTIRTMNLLPREGEEPKRSIIQGWSKGERKIQKFDCLVLHTKKNSAFTPRAENVLRGEDILELAEPLIEY
ncbi:MAG: hypothetical protein CMM18_00230 [Rhodospirillaceae bacterium]|nr:hypothetical protein [Rhodospirillaceae bacterium]|tara:strand:- start:395 stop:1159 length:765 start_codon:yes stop_codon:yes gene_type:complete